MIGSNFDPDWSREEFADEVMLADRFDVLEDEVAPEGYYDDLADFEPADYFSDVEQGRYDDDPSPYAGDYSEM